MARDVLQRLLLTAGLIVLSLLALAPTLLREELRDVGWFTKPISLGLDISGGVQLLYQVKTEEAVKSQLQSTVNNIRADLRGKKVAVADSTIGDDGKISITLLSSTFLEDAKAIVRDKYPQLTAGEERVENGRPTLTYVLPQPVMQKIGRDAVEQAVEIIRSRVDQFGVAEPLIQRSGADRIILQMPGLTDSKPLKQLVGSTTRLEFRLVPQANAPGVMTLKDKQGQPVLVDAQPLMTGDSVKDARVDFDNTGQVEVALTLSSSGARTFADVTAQNVGRQFAIILNNTVYSAPVIREPITGGQASISGGFTMEEAKELRIVLKAGALPAPLKELEERRVGPTLGAESTQRGLIAMAVGVIAICIFMSIYYRKAGLIAVGTLLLNGFLMVGALTLFGATLTLPGLAGLALTIGMAVDSNVIIFERIRDEIRNGVGRDVAVHSGYDKAFSAIFDANVTTFLAASLLYFFGTGPIRGFAVTLTIGIFTTVFCAVYVGRALFDTFPLTSRKQALSI